MATAKKLVRSGRLTTAIVGLVLAAGIAGGDDPAPEKPVEKKSAAPVRGPITNVELERVFSIKELAMPVLSIDPMDTDFGDLEALVETIGTSRVVMLGEQSHGDGATFLAKSRMVKFLHQRMGFDVIAFESGIYDLDRVNMGMREEPNWSEAIKRGIFGIWSQSEQCRQMFEYIYDTHHGHLPGLRPLEVAGFDSQFTLAIKESPFFDDVERFFARTSGVINGDMADQLVQLKVWHTEVSYTPTVTEDVEQQLTEEQLERLEKARKYNREQIEELLKNIDNVVAALDKDVASPESQLRRIHDSRTIGLYRQSLISMKAYSKQVAEGKVTTVEDNNARDKAMAENLLHLVNSQFKDRRVIVWAASFHNMWDAPRVRWQTDEQDMPGAYAKTVTMGSIVKEALKDDLYSIMFTAYAGQTGKPWTGASPLDAAGKGTLEHYFKKAGFKHAIIDFRSLKPKEDGTAHWLRDKVIARPLGYQPMTADWGAHCDAMFYSEVMLPSTKAILPQLPDGVKRDTIPDDDAPTVGKPKF